MPPEITLRPITEDDRDFLYNLYANSREEELAQVTWQQMPMDKATFLNMQFEAQHRHYTTTFTDANFSIVLWKDKPIGRFYIDHRQEEIRLLDIILLPEYRNQGIGSSFLTNILKKAKEMLLPVRLHVEYNNPAMKLYQRFGFYCLEDKGVYKLMEWKPS